MEWEECLESKGEGPWSEAQSLMVIAAEIVKPVFIREQIKNTNNCV